jgi:hypothetical protein
MQLLDVHVAQGKLIGGYVLFVVAEGADLGGSLIQTDAAVNARGYS